MDNIHLTNLVEKENLLWCKATAIVANVVNSNGDYFSTEELTRNIDGKNIPVYKSFEGVPVRTSFEDGIEDVKGMVVRSEWNDENKSVEVICFIDSEIYPDIARGVKLVYLHDVAMQCSVLQGACRSCGNVAKTIDDYCECLKQKKGDGEDKVGENCHGLKFIGFNICAGAAYDDCKINHVFNNNRHVAEALGL